MHSFQVEGLMMDITASEEEIKRWKMAAEEEAEAGRSIEQEFQTQVFCHKHISYSSACSLRFQCPVYMFY
jgi:hypothetical protein